MNKCCICFKEIKGYGNNAEPLMMGLCCDSCNLKKVIPYRLLLSKRETELKTGRFKK